MVLMKILKEIRANLTILHVYAWILNDSFTVNDFLTMDLHNEIKKIKFWMYDYIEIRLAITKISIHKVYRENSK